MLTQQEIAKRYGLSLSRVRVLAMKRDFPAARKIGGPKRRTNFYSTEDISNWWRNRIDGRKRRK